MGRNGSGPEYDLTTDYMRRATITGKSIGVNKIEIIEIDDRKQKSFNELGKFLLKKIDCPRCDKANWVRLES